MLMIQEVANKNHITISCSVDHFSSRARAHNRMEFEWQIQRIYVQMRIDTIQL